MIPCHVTAHASRLVLTINPARHIAAGPSVRPPTGTTHPHKRMVSEHRSPPCPSSTSRISEYTVRVTSTVFPNTLTTRTGLACVAYWGIVLFGYDTCVSASCLSEPVSLSTSGVAGGVVSQPYFETHFGAVTKSQDATVSSNVVSVLQAGAFFGALGSAPLSGRPLDSPHHPRSCLAAFVGRRRTLVGFTVLFCVGAVSLLARTVNLPTDSRRS